MASETFRRSKLIRWIKLQTQVIEQTNEILRDLRAAHENKSYIQAKIDMIESLMKEFGITNEELIR